MKKIYSVILGKRIVSVVEVTSCLLFLALTATPHPQELPTDGPSYKLVAGDNHYDMSFIQFF